MTAVAASVSEAIGDTDLGDQRRRQRLLHTVSTLADQPGEALSQTNADRAECLAIYRLWRNPQLAVSRLVQSIGHASGRRCHGHPQILQVRDTTDIEPWG